MNRPNKITPEEVLAVLNADTAPLPTPEIGYRVARNRDDYTSDNYSDLVRSVLDKLADAGRVESAIGFEYSQVFGTWRTLQAAQRKQRYWATAERAAQLRQAAAELAQQREDERRHAQAILDALVAVGGERGEVKPDPLGDGFAVTLPPGAWQRIIEALPVPAADPEDEGER